MLLSQLSLNRGTGPLNILDSNHLTTHDVRMRRGSKGGIGLALCSKWGFAIVVTLDALLDVTPLTLPWEDTDLHVIYCGTVLDI